MSDYYLGEIIMFAGNYAPDNWAQCNGQMLSISANTALYALIGTQYGGDGVSTFALPNLQVRVPIGQGQGPALTNRVVGQQLGSSQATLATVNMPAHSHSINVSGANGTSPSPAGSMIGLAQAPGLTPAQYFLQFMSPTASGATPPVALAANTIAPAGSSAPFSIMAPWVGITYLICTAGIFPTRSS
jgi:microcystin-dependent protein